MKTNKQTRYIPSNGLAFAEQSEPFSSIQTAQHSMRNTAKSPVPAKSSLL